jgi:hypothetical protein
MKKLIQYLSVSLLVFSGNSILLAQSNGTLSNKSIATCDTDKRALIKGEKKYPCWFDFTAESV